MDAVLGGEAHGARDAVEHLLAGDADRLELQIRDRRLDHGVAHAHFDEQLEIGRHGTGEAPDLGGQPRTSDQLDAAPVLCGHAGKACLDPLDPESVQEPRDLELLLGREDDTDGLLPVAQRRVVEAYPPADAEAVVQRAGPDQAGH